MRIRFGLTCLLAWACSNDSGGSKPSTEGRAGASGTAVSQGGASGAAGSPGGGGVSGTPGSGTGGSAGTGNASIALPEVYPPVRAATPTALLGNSGLSAQSAAFRQLASGDLGTARQALGELTLGTAIQQRFYSTGPTDLLRIVQALDARVQGLDVNGPGHACLSTAPVAVTYALPSGETFSVALQCMQRFGTPGSNAGWVGFGIVPAVTVDAGVGADLSDSGTSLASDAATPSDAGAGPSGGSDFYLIEGQEGGNGGAYHIDPHGNVEAWIAVAERDVPANSQVIMHLRTSAAAGTLELALAGAGVGFCAAHLKTDAGYLFVDGKTNAPPPGGTEQAVGTQYCDEARTGCFDATDLATDLGAASASCAAIGPSSFDIDVALDADTSADAGVNVVTSDIYTFFNQMPVNVPDF
jgi:hypothetical protein